MPKYYDHERGYRAIVESGGTGWDDCPTMAVKSTDSYVALEAFLGSELAMPGDAIDLGCGGGQTSMMLAARGYRVTGVDYSATAITLARRNAPKLAFQKGDCTALEVASASFDLAVDNHVLHCLIGGDRMQFLHEAARVLRPNGLVFSDTMSREGGFDPTRAPVDPTTFISTSGNRYWTSAAELDAAFAAAGFAIVHRAARPSDPGFGDMLVRVARKL